MVAADSAQGVGGRGGVFVVPFFIYALIDARGTVGSGWSAAVGCRGWW